MEVTEVENVTSSNGIKFSVEWMLCGILAFKPWQWQVESKVMVPLFQDLSILLGCFGSRDLYSENQQKIFHFGPASRNEINCDVKWRLDLNWCLLDLCTFNLVPNLHFFIIYNAKPLLRKGQVTFFPTPHMSASLPFSLEYTFKFLYSWRYWLIEWSTATVCTMFFSQTFVPFLRKSWMWQVDATSLPEDSTPVSLQNKAFVPSKAPKRPISEITQEISGSSSYVLFRIADLQRPFDRVCQWA